jgi:hypothetical protein
MFAQAFQRAERERRRYGVRVSNAESLFRVGALLLFVAVPCVAAAQQSTERTPVAILPEASVPATDAAASAFDDAGRPLPVERIVLHTHTADPHQDLRAPAPGRAQVQLQSDAQDVHYTLGRAEDDIPRDLRRPTVTTQTTPVCRGDCLLYLPTARPVRVSALVNGTRVSTDITPPPEGVRLRFQQPSRRALIAAYVLYPTAAALGVSGAVAALLVQDPAVRLGSTIGLFSGAAVVLGIGIAANIVAFDGTVRSEPINAAPAAAR